MLSDAARVAQKAFLILVQQLTLQRGKVLRRAAP